MNINKSMSLPIKLLAMCALAFSVTVNADNNGSSNVARGKTVAVNGGQFFTGGWGGGLISDYSTITDGMFFPLGRAATTDLPAQGQWDQGPVWWQEDEDAVQNSLTVFLGAKPCKVTKLTLQVDNNDHYIVSWIDSNTHLPESVTVIPPPVPSWGMSNVSVPVHAYTDAFTIKGDNGDGLYAISEFQAKGSCEKAHEHDRD